MAKRRRRAVNWFPTFGQNLGEGTGNEHVAGITSQLNILPSGAFTTVIFPLTFDEPRDDDGTATPENTTLSDFISSGYLLQRIVGKFYCEYPWTDLQGEPGSASSPPAVKVGAGFFVAREADQAVGVPIGSNEDYNPLEVDNMREPWIWRRTWFLSSPTVRSATAQSIAIGNGTYGNQDKWNQFPFATSGYNSVMDGPHIDAKTRRVVTNDDRLFFAVSGLQWPLGEDSTYSQVPDVPFHLDYRILGSMIRAGRVKGSF